MKRKIICRCPGLWDCYNEKGEHVNSIQKMSKGWKCGCGDYSCKIYNTLEEARHVAFYGV